MTALDSVLMNRPDAGQTAPEFAMTADDGSVVSTRSLTGTRHVLMFYPEDDTAGCTTQACALRDGWAAVEATGVPVFGVSPDSRDSHIAFRAKYALPYRLLTDDDHRAADAFGVWIEKESGGRAYFGNERTTFVIGEDGRIEHVLPGVKADAHAAQLIEVLGS
ncbi:MAG: peroxiredoxin [Candidatus Limnocylindria bacterium]